MFCNKMILGIQFRSYLYILTTCTVNNTKLTLNKRIDTFEGMKVSNLTLV